MDDKIQKLGRQITILYIIVCIQAIGLLFCALNLLKIQ